MFKLPLMILFSFSLAIAQSQSIDIPVCTDEFAKFLVEQQVAEGSTVEETDKRVRILTRSADFLWKFDQPKAREYFTSAFKVANDRFKEKGFEKTELNGMTTLHADYRFEVIKAIAKHDSEWARKLTEQVLKEYEAALSDRKGLDQGREITEVIQLALDNAKTNPTFTLYLFRRVMREPAGFHWNWGLFGVAISNQTLADQIYGELLVNYANESPQRMLFLSAYPFGTERILGIDKFQYGSSIPESYVPNTDLQVRFLETFLRRVRSYALDPENINRPPEQYRQPESVYMISALQDLEPIVTHRFPTYIQKLSEAKAQAASLLNEETRAKMGEREKQNQTHATTFEQRIERLEKAEEEGKLTDGMILNLLISRPKSEEQFQQVEPWIVKIEEDEARQNSLNYFWFLRAEIAIKEERFTDAEKFAAKVPEIEHRSILAFQIAEKKLKSVNDLATIFQTLNDVGKLARQSPNSVVKAKVLLALSSMYEKVSHSFAIDELSEAVRVINRLENANLLTGRVQRTIKTKEMSFFAVFSLPSSGLESTFLELSKNDFDLTLSNAKALEDKYYRTLAVIAVAKNCINRPKPKVKKAAPKK